MLAITCDLCGRPMVDKACLIDIIEARVVPAEKKPHIVERGAIYSYEACDRCSNQLRSLITKLQAHNRGLQAS